MRRGLHSPPSGSRLCCLRRGLSPDDANQFLALADGDVELNWQADKKRNTLRGRTIINCFFECSTRTRTSFELAGKRLSGDVINMSVSATAMVKGETLIDTAMTLNAMHPDVLVVRHPETGRFTFSPRRSTSRRRSLLWGRPDAGPGVATPGHLLVERIVRNRAGLLAVPRAGAPPVGRTSGPVETRIGLRGPLLRTRPFWRRHYFATC